jgi:hypothetical protein
MTACLAMAHCDGLGSVTGEKKQLSRRMTLDDGCQFFTPDLGCSYFVYSYYSGLGGAAVHGWVAAGPEALRGVVYKTYVEQKHQVASSSFILPKAA